MSAPSQATVVANTEALSGCVMPVRVVSPSSMVNRPLLTVTGTAKDGSLLALLLAAALTMVNLKYPVPLYGEPPVSTRPWYDIVLGTFRESLQVFSKICSTGILFIRRSRHGANSAIIAARLRYRCR